MNVLDENLRDLPKPIGDIVIEECDGVQGEDGMYFHYTDVCSLVSKIVNDEIDMSEYER
jgi:hypothetical protein